MSSALMTSIAPIDSRLALIAEARLARKPVTMMSSVGVSPGCAVAVWLPASGAGGVVCAAAVPAASARTDEQSASLVI